MMPSPRFPQEICEQFVDVLGVDFLNSIAEYNEGDLRLLQSLGCCSLVSRSLFQRPRSYMFQRVRIRRNAAERLSRLLEIMTPSGTPDLSLGVAPLIKEFSIKMDVGDIFRIKRETDPRDQDGDAGIGRTTLAIFQLLEDTNFHLVLDALHGPDYGVQKVDLHFGDRQIIRWSDISPDIQRSLRALTLSPFLRSLYLSKISQLPPTLFNGSSITDLRLDHIDVFEKPHEAVIDSVESSWPFPRLECLHTDHGFSFDLSPETSPLRELKQLKVHSVNSEHNRITEEMLRVVGNTLEIVRLEYLGDVGLRLFNLADVPNLKMLSLFHFRSFGDPFSIRGDEGMRDICAVITPRSPMKELTSIHLELHFNELDVREDFLYSTTNEGTQGAQESCWETIDKALSNRESYPALQNVYLQVYGDILLRSPELSFDEKSFKDGTREQLTLAFPRVCASESIKWKVRTDAMAGGHYQPYSGTASDSEIDEESDDSDPESDA